MSTLYRLSNRESALPKAELLSKLEEHGVREVSEAEREVPAKPGDDSFILTDGTYFLWAYPDDDGRVSEFERFGGNDPTAIVDAIEGACEECVLSEHDDGYFDDEEDGEDEECEEHGTA
jgi:hypothetical protein